MISRLILLDILVALLAAPACAAAPVETKLESYTIEAAVPVAPAPAATPSPQPDMSAGAMTRVGALHQRTGSDAPNWVYLLTAAACGALFGGIVQIAVSCCRWWVRRRAVSKALLAEVRACCALAAAHEHYLSDHLLADWPTTGKKQQYFRHFRAAIWQAAIKDICALPSNHLERLVAFHAYLTAIDGKLDAYVAEQDRLGLQTDQAVANSIHEAMKRLAHIARQMCEAVAKNKDVRSLNGLPMEYPDIFFHD